MPFEIIRNDIAKVKADAIVNTANPEPRIGAGTDHAIHRDAGPQLLEARKQIGNIAPGEAAVTPAFNLNAKYVIHAVGPAWQGGDKGEEQILRRAYDNALEIAVLHDCKTVAFPLMATGTYGFPKNKGMSIAISAFTDFLMTHDIRIILVVFDKLVVELAGQLFDDLHHYVDQDYVDAAHTEEYGILHCATSYQELTARLTDLRRPIGAVGAIPPEQPKFPADKKSTGLKELVSQPGIGFHKKLFQLIDERGLKDSTVYDRAGISKQQFSQIRNNPAYTPTKSAAIRLALALELDYEATQDFLGSAGYTLSQSIPADIIVEYYIRHGEHNAVKINIELDNYNQPLLLKTRE